MFSVICLTQCTVTNRIAKPMSLDKALEDVAIAIRNANIRGEGQKKTGLMASEVTVALNVENVAKDEGSVNLSVVPAAGATLGGGWKGSVTAAQGNTVTIKYQNMIFAGINTVVGSQTGDKTLQLVDTITDGTGGTMRLIPSTGTNSDNSALRGGMGGNIQNHTENQ